MINQSVVLRSDPERFFTKRVSNVTVLFVSNRPCFPNEPLAASHGLFPGSILSGHEAAHDR